MRNKGVVYLIGIIVITLAMIGCDCDDCPTCPNDTAVPYQGRAYVGMNFGSPSIIVFDAATDSLLDSLTIDPDRSYLRTQVTSNGEYVLVGNGLAQTVIIDAATMTEIRTISSIGSTVLVRNGEYLFGSRGGSLKLHSVPDGELVQTGSIPNSFGRLTYDGSVDCVYGAMRLGVQGDLHDSTDIICVEMDSLTISKRITIHDDEGVVYYIRRVAIDFETGIGHALGFGIGEFYLRFDAGTGLVLNSFQMYASFGDLVLSPDKSEVYVSDPGALERFNPGTIYIFDAATGEYTGGISVVGYLEGSPGEPLDVWDLSFSPDGSTLYAATGHILVRLGTVLKIDVKTRAITEVLFPKIDRLPGEVAVGPIP